MSTKKMVKEKNEQPERHLYEAVNILMKEFQTPELFLDFLNQSLYWTDLYNKETKEEKINLYLIKMMIGEIVLPWLKNRSNAMEAITIALKNVQDFCGHKGFHKNISSIMIGFSIDIEDPCGHDFLKKYLSMFATMYEIGDYISEYELALYLQREQRNSAEAA